MYMYIYSYPFIYKITNTIENKKEKYHISFNSFIACLDGGR